MRRLMIVAAAAVLAACSPSSDKGGLGSESDATRGSDIQDRAYRGGTNFPGDSGAFMSDTNATNFGVQRSLGAQDGTASPAGDPKDRTGSRP